MLILASSSPVRKIILQKLLLNFKVIAPNIDEKRQKNETPTNLVKRLAAQKAAAVAKRASGIIIASDQVAVVNDNILTKPLTHEKALCQLQLCSGKKVDFLNALCVLNTNNSKQQVILDTTSIFFKVLTNTQIANYLDKEKPYHCAGSMKFEGLGIALVEKIIANDTNSLMGLPLIILIKMLNTQGINVI